MNIALTGKGLAGLAALLLLAGLLPGTAGAAGGAFRVLQCSDFYKSSDIEQTGSWGNEFAVADQCEGPNARLSVTNFKNTFKNHGAQFMYTPPGGSRIVGVDFDSHLRSDNQIRAEVSGYSNQHGWMPIALGQGPNAQWQHHAANNLNAEQLVIRLYCDAANCVQSNEAHAWVRNVDIKVQDLSDPQLSNIGGGLTSDGWLRGTQALSAKAGDGPSGLIQLHAYVNGQLMLNDNAKCAFDIGWPYAIRFDPCPLQRVFTDKTFDTTAAPFHNGENKIEVVASDFAANLAHWAKTVRIDNEAPAAAFASAQDPEDPELIRASASDKFSGIADARVLYRQAGSGEWKPLEAKREGEQLFARVDSLADPPGVYEFMLDVHDVAGNRTQTTLRADGQPMRLQFPLRAATRLTANLEPSGAGRQTIRYGRSAVVGGRLTGADGNPLAGQTIQVVQRYNPGASFEDRADQVQTDGEGNWRAVLAPGPSRRVSAQYAGSPKHGPAGADAGQLRVKTGIALRGKKRVREGRRLKLRGRVKHLGARIPAGGKAVEIQVKYGPRTWDTVKEALYTKPNGRFRFRYRFSRVLDRNTRFKFRAKVAKEAGWAYRAPAKSRTRRVLLIAR